MWADFKSFLLKTNALALAIAFILGVALAAVVSSLVADIIMPPIGLIVGGINFSDFRIILKHGYKDLAGTVHPDVVFAYGNFLQNVFDFLLVAIAIFAVVKMNNRLKKPAPAAAPVTPPEVALLTEIRDALVKKP